ncbi:transposase, partial [Skermanella stibiiresistens SB22]
TMLLANSLRRRVEVRSALLRLANADPGRLTMSLKPMEIPPVPEETARVARAAFPKGTPFLRFRDELGVIYRDEMFAALFPKSGQPATAPWRLALISVFQYVEG